MNKRFLKGLIHLMGKSNRGPAASAENRAALIKAGHKVFSERGLRVPFSSIAREAGVSQGVLYRHFPSLMGLAIAVFEEGLDEIEAAVAERSEDESAFTACWNEFVVSCLGLPVPEVIARPT